MTNNQAEAYAKRAMQLQNIDDKTIENVLDTMKALFDRFTEEEICMKMFGCKS